MELTKIKQFKDLCPKILHECNPGHKKILPFNLVPPSVPRGKQK